MLMMKMMKMIKMMKTMLIAIGKLLFQGRSPNDGN